MVNTDGAMVEWQKNEGKMAKSVSTESRGHSCSVTRSNYN